MTKKFSHAVIYNGVFYPANTPIEVEEVKEPEPEQKKEPEQEKPKGRQKK